MAQIEFNVGEIANDGTGDALRNAFIAQQNMNTDLYSDKVDKIFGKELSSNDFRDEDVIKLASIEAGAEVNVQADWNQADNTADDFIKNKPTQIFSSVGYFHYTDVNTQTTPLTIVADTNKKLTNDGLGAQTNLTQAPYGVSTLFNTTTNEFDFSQLSIGDTLDLRVDLLLTTTSANQKYLIFLRVGEGSVAQYDLPIFSGQIKNISSDNRIIGNEPFSIDYQDHIDNPATLYILSDDDGSVKVNGWYTSIIRKSVNIIEIPDDFIPRGGTEVDKEVTGSIVAKNPVGDLTTKFFKIISNDGATEYFFVNGNGEAFFNGNVQMEGVTDVDTLEVNNIARAPLIEITTAGSDTEKKALVLRNFLDEDFRQAITVQAGTSANQRRYFQYLNHLGVRTNLMGFNAQNGFIAFDSVLAYHFISCNSGGTSSFNSYGTNQLRINADEGATGTNGMAIYDGTANPTSGNIMYNLSSAGIYANKGRIIQAQSPDNLQFNKLFCTNGSAYLQSSLALRLYNTGNKFNFADSGLVDRMVVDVASSKVKVGIGTSTPNANSIIDVVSTTQFSRPFPVMTQAQRVAIASPQVGGHVYQSDGTEGVYVYKSSGWAFAY